MKIVILAGGVGQRLWPMSKTSSPKQIQPFFGRDTLLQKTVKRLRRGFSYRDLYIVTGENFAEAVRAQVPKFIEDHIIVEPARRNTAAAIGLAAYKIAKENSKEVMISIASDHFIKNEQEFIKGLKNMAKVVGKHPSAVCLMGVVPRYPETGYGYIEKGKKAFAIGKTEVFHIKRFTEKPSRAAAENFIQSGVYFWNPSYFAWRVDQVKALFKAHLPKTHMLLEKTVAGDEKAFSRIESEAIDYGIMEKIKEDFYMIPAKFYWTDIGHWASVRDVQAEDRLSTVRLGLHHSIDVRGSLIYNYTDRVLTAVGVEDLLIVQTDTGTLVCHRERAQDVKILVEEMKKKKHLKRFI